MMEKPRKETLVRSTRKKPIEKPKSIIVDENLKMYSEADNIKIIDDETSDELKELKHLEIANKPKVITSEMQDAMKVEEEVVLDVSVERYLDVDITQGLSDEQVETRKSQGLVNKTNDVRGKSILGIILSNVFTFFNMLYVVIAIVLALAGAGISNFTFVIVVLFNLIIGIVQQIKAKLTVEKMTLMSAPSATVVRNGQKLEIPVSDVVLDDIIYFAPGKQICADSVVIQGNVEVNAAAADGSAPECWCRWLWRLLRCRTAGEENLPNGNALFILYILFCC